MTTPPTEEVKKDSKHSNIFEGVDKYDFFTDEEKNRIGILISEEISRAEDLKRAYDSVVNREAMTERYLVTKEQYTKIVEFYTKDLELLTRIQNKINKDI